jgi:hypothetical protein
MPSLSFTGSTPNNYGRVYDLNSLVYEVQSPNAGQVNFTFVVQLYLNNVNNATQQLIATKKMYPQNVLNGTGYVWVNPSDIFKNYISPSNQLFDIDPNITTITEAINSCKNFTITVNESWGTPPVIQNNVSKTLWLYNGAQQFISYDSVFGGGNNQWVMLTGQTSGASYLTNANNVYLDENDYYFLYFLNPAGHHIDWIEYKFYYISGSTSGGGGNVIIIKGDAPDNSQSLIISDPNNINPMGPKPGDVMDNGYSIQTIIESGSTAGLAANTLGTMFYIPVGMKTLRKKFPTIVNNWIYYTINIFCHSKQPFVALNSNPFTIINTCRDARFTNYKILFLNNHGGFDYFCFDKATLIKEKDKRDTFTQDLQPGYSTFNSGNIVYNTNPDQEITLTSSLLENQVQEQVLMGLFHSPVVFMVYTYTNPITLISTSYCVPYIIVDTDTNYLNTNIDQTFTFSITLTPANKLVSQKL